MTLKGHQHFDAHDLSVGECDNTFLKEQAPLHKPFVFIPYLCQPTQRFVIGLDYKFPTTQIVLKLFNSPDNS